MDPSEWSDFDYDGLGDNADTDDDNDSVLDIDDAFPNDATESSDIDGDGIGDNADPDDDNDGVPDHQDGFPYDANENTDTDGDGIGDNADTDVDGDGWGDIDEINCDSDPWDPLSVPTDRLYDNDGDVVCDIDDPDGDKNGSAVPGFGMIATVCILVIGAVIIDRRSH
jgi:hypothetical protein